MQSTAIHMNSKWMSARRFVPGSKASAHFQWKNYLRKESDFYSFFLSLLSPFFLSFSLFLSHFVCFSTFVSPLCCQVVRVQLKANAIPDIRFAIRSLFGSCAFSSRIPFVLNTIHRVWPVNYWQCFLHDFARSINDQSINTMYNNRAASWSLVPLTKKAPVRWSLKNTIKTCFH